jgi:hypothetical protein
MYLDLWSFWKMIAGLKQTVTNIPRIYKQFIVLMLSRIWLLLLFPDIKSLKPVEIMPTYSYILTLFIIFSLNYICTYFVFIYNLFLFPKKISILVFTEFTFCTKKSLSMNAHNLLCVCTHKNSLYITGVKSCILYYNIKFNNLINLFLID